VNNHTFVLNYSKNSSTYSLDIQKVYLDTLEFSGDKIFEMEPDTQTIHIRFSGINVVSLVWGDMNLLANIPLDGSGFNINNITVDLTFEPVVNADNVHWTLKDTSSFSFGSMTIKMGSPALQLLIKQSMPLIIKMVNLELAQLSTVLDQEIQKLNNLLNTEDSTPMIFNVPLFGGKASLNLTMPTAPDLNTQDLIKIDFNGLFYNNGETHQSLAGVNYPPRIQHYLSE
jgi:hypothetical protein